LKLIVTDSGHWRLRPRILPLHGRARLDFRYNPPARGQWSKSHTKFGDVKWADPVTHEARNTGTTEQHVIRVELK
jgi:hypothetical protein